MMEDTFRGFEHKFWWAEVGAVSLLPGGLYLSLPGHRVCIERDSVDFADAIEFLRERGILKRPAGEFEPINRISEN